jgi:hypothetical protein
MNNINRWVVDKDYSIIGKFPHWQGKILRNKNEEKLEETTRKIYALAYEEELYRIVNKGEQGDDVKTLFGLTKFDFHSVKRKDGSDGFINEEGLDWFNNCEQQCKVSYYNLDGQITTKWVENFFIFHANLRPEKYTKLDRNNRMYTRFLPIQVEESYDDGYETYIVHLCSDIWFPRVVGWLDSEGQSYDNSELAALNIPRLNRFLQRTKELILSLGGKWELGARETVTVDEYDEERDYYRFHHIDPRIVDSKIIYVDGVQKKVYPASSSYMGVENIPPECQISEDGISLEIDVKPRNHWCMLANKSEEDLPTWDAIFPPEKFATQQDTWPFIKTILEVGWQEEILRIFTGEADFRQFIHDVDNGMLPMPSLGSLSSILTNKAAQENLLAENLSEDIQDMTRISYYEKSGQIVDKYVGEQELGKILYNYHLGSLGTYQGDYSKHFLHPYYGCLRFYQYTVPEYSPEGCSISIMLTSDIWFPVVKGSVEKKVGIWHTFGADKAAHYERGFDNRELANRHTPRLNRFLSAIAEKVIEMGGKWSVGEYVNSEYREQMTLTGIKLDV